MSSLSKDLAAAKTASDSEMWALLVKNRLEKLFLEARDHENRYGLHASAILASDNDFCYREQVLSLFYKMNQGENLPIKLLKIFAQGNAMHEKWYTLFRQAKIDVAIERSLFLEQYDLSFTIDALLNIFKEEIICDVKSQNTFAFKKQRGHPSGEKQVNFYLWALTVYTGIPHRRGFVLVDSKDDQEIKVVPVTYSKEKVAPYVQRLKDIQVMKREFIEEHIVPPRKCKNCDVKRAAQCNMRDACFNIGMGRVKLDAGSKQERTQGLLQKG